ncbi:hypothetical protein E3N88_03278 [Mikania micrantha]|uniref:Uncharacterized protein n=1 Tax=Mikania micrantha TaxID=192012 RepID=A0A5N6Q6A1_9ASTR|nr:hypothetical protein E3N88_03278 [Mikania micrantha]
MEGPIASYMASPILELYCMFLTVIASDCAAFAICVAALVALHDEYARPMLTSEHVLCICNSRSKDSGYEKEVKDGFCDEDECIQHKVEDYEFSLSMSYLRMCFPALILENLFFVKACATAKQKQVTGVIDVDRCKDIGFETTVEHGFWMRLDSSLVNFVNHPFYIYIHMIRCVDGIFSHNKCSWIIYEDRSNDSGYEKAVKDGFCDEVSSSELAHLPCTPRDLFLPQ